MHPKRWNIGVPFLELQLQITAVFYDRKVPISCVKLRCFKMQSFTTAIPLHSLVAGRCGSRPYGGTCPPDNGQVHLGLCRLTNDGRWSSSSAQLSETKVEFRVRQDSSHRERIHIGWPRMKRYSCDPHYGCLFLKTKVDWTWGENFIKKIIEISDLSGIIYIKKPNILIFGIDLLICPMSP